MILLKSILIFPSAKAELREVETELHKGKKSHHSICLNNISSAFSANVDFLYKFTIPIIRHLENTIIKFHE